MFSLDDLFAVCDKLAPISLSKKMISNGEYDNSGIIIRSHEQVSNVLFSLDLSNESVNKAVELGCDTIITHHPAIYYPVKSLDYSNALSSPLVRAIENKINVVSMHLNLDVAKNGIDKNLAEGLGAKEVKILDYIDDEHGYGREFCVKEKLSTYVEHIKEEFNTQQVVVYGNSNDEVNKVASFCGAGAGYAEKMLFDGKITADTIVTSDMAHHDIKYLIESGKKIILIPHHSSESYGFNAYYKDCKEMINKRANCFYFDDKRFW